MATTASEVRTRDDFDALVKSIEARPGYRRPAAFAVGIASFSIADEGTNGAAARVLDTYFPVVNLRENYGSAAVLANVAGHDAGSATFALNAQQVDAALASFAPFLHDGKEHANIRALQDVREFLRREEQGQLVPRRVVVTFIGDLAEKPVDAHDVYLRLHLLSHRKVQPHGLSLEGAIALLTNVAWTSAGPFAADQFDRIRSRLRAKGQVVQVFSVDKFPRMTDYVVPSGVRIADADRVRLGAYVGEGTTVMHEGFINFNAGTLGASMVEGRVSAGVVVGNGSDIGGGASIMGTLSGGGKIVVKVGENSLVGANAGIGISLGNDCTVEAGLYVTAGSKVKLPDGRVVKAAELSGQDNLLFIRNSQTGAVEVRAKKNQVVLNPELHSKQ